MVRLRDSCAGIGIDRVERVEILTTEYTEAEESYLKGTEKISVYSVWE